MSTLHIPVTAGDHTTGPADAPVTLVEYGDYQCPYCGQAYPVVKDLLARWGGQVRFVFRNFPLVDLHPEALNAALVAEFAATRGLFWQTHDLLFENQRSLGPELYADLGTALGLEISDLQAALDHRDHLSRIEFDEEGGIRSGVNGTPTFFVNGVRVDRGTAGLESAIASALGETVR